MFRCPITDSIKTFGCINNRPFKMPTINYINRIQLLRSATSNIKFQFVMGTNQSTLLISMDDQAIANEINAIGPSFADYASAALRNGLTGDVVEALLKQDQISAIFEMLGVDNVVHKTSLQLRFDKLMRGEIEPSVMIPVSTASLAVSTINVTANPIVIADAYSADTQDCENNFPERVTV